LLVIPFVDHWQPCPKRAGGQRLQWWPRHCSTATGSTVVITKLVLCYNVKKRGNILGIPWENEAPLARPRSLWDEKPPIWYFIPDQINYLEQHWSYIPDQKHPQEQHRYWIPGLLNILSFRTHTTTSSLEPMGATHTN
jgi:hypothetical protein